MVDSRLYPIKGFEDYKMTECGTVIRTRRGVSRVIPEVEGKYRLKREGKDYYLPVILIMRKIKAIKGMKQI